MYDTEIMQTPDIFSGGAMLRKAPSLIQPKATGIGHGMPELAIEASKNAIAVPYLLALTQRHDNAEANNRDLTTAYNKALLQGMSQDRSLAGNEVIAKLLGQLAPHKRFTEQVLNGIDQVAPIMNTAGAREDATAINQLDSIASPMSEIFKNTGSGYASLRGAGIDTLPVVQQIINSVTGNTQPFIRVPTNAEITALSRENAARLGNTTNTAGVKSTTKSVYDSRGNKVPTESVDEQDAKLSTKSQGSGIVPDQPIVPTQPTIEEDAERKATHYIMQHLGNDVTFDPAQGDTLVVHKSDGSSKAYSISKILQLMQGQ